MTIQASGGVDAPDALRLDPIALPDLSFAPFALPPVMEVTLTPPTLLETGDTDTPANSEGRQWNALILDHEDGNGSWLLAGGGAMVLGGAATSEIGVGIPVALAGLGLVGIGLVLNSGGDTPDLTLDDASPPIDPETVPPEDIWEMTEDQIRDFRDSLKDLAQDVRDRIVDAWADGPRRFKTP
jgi:hypothetical protein